MNKFFCALVALTAVFFSSCSHAEPLKVSSKEEVRLFKPIKITIYVPIQETEDLNVIVDAEQLLAASPALNEQIRTLQRHPKIGRLGNYESVFEVSLGFEGFTPTGDATPTLGEISEPEITPSVSFVVYSEPTVSETEIENYLLDVLRAHPWEHPVVELYQGGEVHLWSPVEVDHGE